MVIQLVCVGGGSLILATRLFSRFPFARLRRCADSVCDKLTRRGTVRMQPSPLPVDHFSCKTRSICSSGRDSHVCCACPSAGCARKAACRRTPLLEGGLILARRLRSLLYISDASLLLGADLKFVRFGCHRRAKLRDCKLHSRRRLLGIGG